MNTVIIVISIIVSTILLMQIVGWLQNSHYYQCYRETYESLPSKKFYRNYNQIYDYQYEFNDNGFIYFIDQGSFQLNRIVSMQSESILADFYQWYWRKKMIKWFQDNVNIDELPEYKRFNPNEPQFGNWIKVEDALPTKDGYYIICDEHENVCQCYFHSNRFGVRTNPCSKVTHWMPLPPNPTN